MSHGTTRRFLPGDRESEVDVEVWQILPADSRGSHDRSHESASDGTMLEAMACTLVATMRLPKTDDTGTVLTMYKTSSQLHIFGTLSQPPPATVFPWVGQTLGGPGSGFFPDSKWLFTAITRTNMARAIDRLRYETKKYGAKHFECEHWMEDCLYWTDISTDQCMEMAVDGYRAAILRYTGKEYPRGPAKGIEIQIYDFSPNRKITGSGSHDRFLGSREGIQSV